MARGLLDVIILPWKCSSFGTVFPLLEVFSSLGTVSLSLKFYPTLNTYNLKSNYKKNSANFLDLPREAEGRDIQSSFIQQHPFLAKSPRSPRALGLSAHPSNEGPDLGPLLGKREEISFDTAPSGH